MATTNGYLPASEIITDASQAAGDPSAGIVGRTRYLSFVQRGLALMCQDTNYEKRYFDAPVPSDLIVDLPKWMAGMDGVWLYNGVKCNPMGAVNVYEKEDFVHGGGPGYFSGVMWGNQGGVIDAMQYPPGQPQEPWNLRYYGIHKGRMYLSTQCTGFQWIRIKYSGLGFDAWDGDETLEVPMWAREAITDYATMKAAELRQYEEGKTNLMRAVLKDKQEEFRSPAGSWSRARGYWGMMDYKQRNETVLYISRMGHGGETI